MKGDAKEMYQEILAGMFKNKNLVLDGYKPRNLLQSSVAIFHSSMAICISDNGHASCTHKRHEN